MKGLHEECGLFGIIAEQPANLASLTYYGLFSLQHRGQQSCGIVVNDDGLFNTYCDLGLVSNVFDKGIIKSLGEGNMALGHVRYGTADTATREDCQPIVINHVKGRMALAHNGNISNAYKLREKLELEGAIFHSTSDAELISNIIIKERLSTGTIEEAINKTMYHLEGAYSLVVMSPTKLIGVRDPRGFRPLCYGKTKDGMYVIASESCALDAINAEFIRDIEPGEIIVIDKKNGVRSIKDHCGKMARKSCVFEYVYFARSDSIIDECSVYEARVRAGEFLANQYPVDADVVIGVPDSGIDAAIGYSKASGIPYSLGFVKNKYIGRTFIAPNQKERENLVRIKLNPIASAVNGKRVVLIDDSIVRGTTSARIVKLIREAGAKEVHMRVTSPRFVDICYYGTDIESKEMLIANNHTVEETAKIIGVDSLGYLTLDNVKRITGDKYCDRYCTACFDCNHPIEIPETRKKYKYDEKIMGRKD